MPVDDPRGRPPSFFDLDFAAVSARIEGDGLPRYVAVQLWQWVYHKLVWDPRDWSNIAKARRDQLKALFSFALPEAVASLDDGQGTSKQVLRLADGQKVECVSITEKGHMTFCISSQVGCPLGCRFCATGRMGLVRNLTTAEIVSQVVLMKQAIGPFVGKLNLVFMGMGEPLLNQKNLFRALDIVNSEEGLSISPKNITVSTAGIKSGIVDLFARYPNLKLSLSLNGFDAASRLDLMPVGGHEPIEPILDLLRNHRSRNRVTFEYVLLPGINDAPAHARQLASWLHGIPCKINLIPFNPFPGAAFKRPSTQEVDRFATLLHQRHFTVVVRWSKGGEIAAACGQLAGVTTP
jgi:23S rRNA (adenine2503-C2)-methyltransferase